MTETTGQGEKAPNQWIKVSEKTPQFKKIVLGAKLPNQIELVQLDRIDENGAVFHRANSGIDLSFLTVKKTIEIDYWMEIELPKE
jgi:hypothetical protein